MASKLLLKKLIHYNYNKNVTNAILIINKFDFLDLQSFSLVQILFLLQYAFIEKLLKLLIAIVNTKLFKTVNSEVL